MVISSVRITMLYIGADACKAGWVVVILSESFGWKVDVSPTVPSLWNSWKDAKLILIDVPIGLRDCGTEERTCDKEARHRLGLKRGTSVFPVPCRAALEADTYEKASRINKDKTGRGLSRHVVNQRNETLLDFQAV